jgi:hypothetical protein
LIAFFDHSVGGAVIILSRRAASGGNCLHTYGGLRGKHLEAQVKAWPGFQLRAEFLFNALVLMRHGS